MEPSPLGALIPGRQVEGDPMSDEGADVDVSSDEEGSSSVSASGGSEGSDLESMTGKGIKCLCSELLELKKSSDEDFQRNLRSNYSTFIRILQEVADVELQVMELSRHVSDQKRLVSDLMNFCLDYFSEGSLEMKNDNELAVDDCFLSDRQTDSIIVLEKLDALSSEQRFEEVLDILENESQTLEKINVEGDQISVENFSSCKSALSEWRTKLIDHLADMAGHPRVSASELQKLLSLLGRLGEDNQANSLLIKFYHSHLVKQMDNLQVSKSLLNQLYIMDLAKLVFSVISQAARSFVMLHGETSPYSSEFMVWVTEEIKTFTHYFDLYVKSISEVNKGLSLAAECMKCTISFCSLLKPQRLTLLPFMIKTIQPCMEEVLQMHVNYLRRTINGFTVTDAWILDKFLVSEITGEKLSLVGDDGKLEYYFLTDSGMKFIALTQVFLEDISPFNILQMENSILRSLADLFIEYIQILEKSICSFGNCIEKGSPRISYAQTLSQQLSILVNSSTLVHYFFSIAKCFLEGSNISRDEHTSENYSLSRKKEIEAWIFLIQNLADQLRGSFCQQFVCGYISSETCTPRTDSDSSEPHMENMSPAASSHFPMPSSEFQVLFQQLWQLRKRGISNFVGADEEVEKLLKDLIAAIIAMTSDSCKFWRDSEDSSPFQHSFWLKQLVLDIHFLVEIAMFGGYFSDRLMEASRNLVMHVKKRFSPTESDTSSAAVDYVWAATAAQAAVRKLIETEAIKLEPDENHIEDFDYASAQSDERDATGCVGFSDREVESFSERDIVNQQNVENSGSTSLDGIAIDVIDKSYYDRDSFSPSTCLVNLEDVQDGFGTKMELPIPTKVLDERTTNIQKVDNSGITSLDVITINFTDKLYYDKYSFSPSTCHVDLVDVQDGPRTKMELEMPAEILEGCTTYRRSENAAYMKELVIDGTKNISYVESNGEKNRGIYSVESRQTNGVAAKNSEDNAIEEHFVANPLPNETTGNLLHINDEQDSAEKVIVAVTHTTHIFDSSTTSTFEPFVHGNYGEQAIGMSRFSRRPSECSSEDYGYALDNDPDTVSNRIMQDSVAGMATRLLTGSEEQSQYAQPVSAIGELSKSDTRTDLFSTSDGFNSPPKMTQHVQKIRDDDKFGQPNSSPSKLKTGHGFSKIAKTGGTSGNARKDSMQHSGKVRK